MIKTLFTGFKKANYVNTIVAKISSTKQTKLLIAKNNEKEKSGFLAQSFKKVH